jgi:enoyl-CoA hydratase
MIWLTKQEMRVTFQTIVTEPNGPVLLIRLNRPEALNAINGVMMAELAAALKAAEADPAVRCIILTGSEKAFAAGADVREMADKGFVDMVNADPFAAGAEIIAQIRKPIIAAVAGFALGGGCELALMADFIIAADTARFGLPETNLAIIPGMGGTQRLPRAVGKAKAMDLVLTGRMMDAAEAERCGLVARVVPADQLLAEALAAAQRIATKSMVAVMAAKQAVNRAGESALNEGLRAERSLFHGLFATQDQKEGMAAFLEKRPPEFRDL